MNCFHFLVILISVAYEHLCISFRVDMFSFQLVIFLGEKLLGHIIIIILGFNFYFFFFEPFLFETGSCQVP